MTKQIQKKPELTIGQNGRVISSRIGQYSDNVTAELARKFSGKIVSVRDIARVQYGRLNSHNEQYVRRKVTRAVNVLLESGIPAFPIYETTGRHKVVGIKVLAEYNEEDMEQLREYQETAVKRGEISLAKAKAIEEAADGKSVV